MKSFPGSVLPFIGALAVLPLSVSCNQAAGSLADATTDQSNEGLPPDAASDAGTDDVQGLDLFARMVGLWSGPATDTRLGNFPLTNMDFQPVGDGVLFGRVDLDESNSLRFAFEVENHEGTRKLIFRNGGLFQGIERDTRTELVSTGDGVYRFCAVDAGCDYVDAVFTFLSEARFDLRVLVRGQLHETWNATRVESRVLPEGFPEARALSPVAPFPDMASVRVNVTWTTPLSAPADVWAVFSTTTCLPTGACQFSRWIKTRAEIGATSASITVDQVHQGSYRLLALVDRNNNLSAVRRPDSGDTISVPDVTAVVPSEGQAVINSSANYTVP